MNRSALITLLAGIVGLGLVAGGGASAAPSAKPSAAGHHAVVRRHHPAPSHFTHGGVDNRWFPLKPGNRYVYRGAEEGKRGRDVLVVTYRTRVVDGVVCRMVFDSVWKNGRLNEHTHDFYAQTRSGTVWYFGERPRRSTGTVTSTAARAR